MGEIIEKLLGIPPDYQYKALHSSNFLKANWHRNKLVVLEKIIKPSKKMRILDLGTGSGNFELNFASRVKEIVGVDYNNEVIDFLSRKLKEGGITNVRLVNEDMRNISKIENLGKFDVIVMVDVIEHLEKSQSEKIINYLAKILIKKGLLVIVTPNYKSLWIVIERFLDTFRLVPFLNGGQHLVRYCPEKLIDLLTKNGFLLKEIKGFNLLSYMIPNKKLSGNMTLVELNWPIFTGNLLVGKFVRSNFL